MWHKSHIIKYDDEHSAVEKSLGLNKNTVGPEEPLVEGKKKYTTTYDNVPVKLWLQATEKLPAEATYVEQTD